MSQEAYEQQVNAFKSLQKDFENAVESRNKLESQLKENQLVLTELSLLKPGAKVYKLIGPVLVLNDHQEAQHNVTKRIEYITDEIKRTETRIHDLEGKQEKQREVVIKLQEAIQRQQMAQQAVAAV